MKLNPIKANMVEVNVNGYDILFSYKTPVACIDPTNLAYRTTKKWSVTTSRHINQWFALKGMKNETWQTEILEASQEYFDNLIAGVK